MKKSLTAGCLLLMCTVALSQNPPFNPSESIPTPGRASPTARPDRYESISTVIDHHVDLTKQIIDLQREKVNLLTADRKALRNDPMFDAEEHDAVDRQLAYAKLELAELEGDLKAIVQQRKELLIRAEETLKYARRQIEKGTGKPADFRKANIDFLDAKIALIKAEDAALKAAPVGKVPAKPLSGS